ncbi:unnamed protein product [Echinostoma caproni]|uniref:Secreted protein n=1 Tax=Echinostoma caproni TaxID=27848 RepID=A0A183BER6_9TREM|nr:unnamed protein product [Echinostoma caproni]
MMLIFVADIMRVKNKTCLLFVCFWSMVHRLLYKARMGKPHWMWHPMYSVSKCPNICNSSSPLDLIHSKRFRAHLSICQTTPYGFFADDVCFFTFRSE